ncbi:MAG TPA: hypothetical protein PKZ84_23950 [Anaerolineae bacterium]|nr:hypothetical protein [Anaerolineae bacterium]
MRIRDNGYDYYEERPRLGQRLGRFLALVGVVFAVVTAVVVVQRLSDDTLALIIGLLLAGVPLLAIIGLLIFVLARRGQRQPPQQMTIPPIIMQIPQQPQQPALPDYGLPWEATMQRTGGRQWEVIGEE